MRKAVDVVGTLPDGGLIGVEVTLHLSNLVDNLELDIQAQPNFQTLYVLCFSLEAVRQAKRAIANAPGLDAHRSKIKVETIGAWL